MASTSISVATSGTPTNNKKFTFSFWVKRHKLGSTQSIYIHERGSGYGHTHKVEFGFHSEDTFYFGTWDGSAEYYSRTKRTFRDTNAWMHIMVVVDSTQATNTNRLKWYFNGEQYSIDGAAFNAGPSYPAQNWVFDSNTWSHNIGRYVASNGASNYLDASLSDFCFVDGQALTPSSFGETDTDTGEWRIKDFTAGDITWGTNGYRILKDGNSITDVSSNSHNFTSDTGTLTKTEDCPSNIFATLNPLYKSGVSFSYGNLQGDNQTSDWTTALSTIGASSGKYYAEFKVTDDAAGITRNYFGVTNAKGANYIAENSIGNASTANAGGDNVGYYSAYGYKNSSQVGSFASYTIGDIIGVAMDLDNGAVYFHKNGTWQNSGVPTSGSSKTGAITITTGETYLMGGTVYNATYQANFGNGYFGSTQISSAGTNASGIGIFEYDVPTGYTALSTKGLNL